MGLSMLTHSKSIFRNAHHKIVRFDGHDVEQKPWQRVIVGIDETREDMLARESIGPDDNVIVRTIVEPKEARP